MTKFFKLISAPLFSLLFLLSLTGAGYAETTVSAEVGFIFNTLLFLICGFLVMFMAAGFAMLRIWDGNFKKCISNLRKEYWFVCDFRNYVLA